jgi:hypothetical protein
MERTSPQTAAAADTIDSVALQLSSSELEAFDRSPAAEHLARLEADVELNTQLMLSSYQGPGWERFALALAEYGVQVIGAWLGGRERKIFAKCARKGIRGLVPMEYDEDDARGLANETVAKAIATFRSNVLCRGRWKPAQGASLRTFFVGQCLFQFPNIYRKWQRGQVAAYKAGRAVAAIGTDFLPSIPDIEDGAELRRHLRKLAVGGFESADALKIAHRLGYPLAEIAEILGISERGVEGRIYRDSARKKVDRDA